MAHDVFISYSSKDQLVAEKVREFLEEHGIPCWMASREIIPGHPDWAAAITQAIQSSKIFVLIHSESSNSSDQVLNEIHNADANHLIFITFKIDQTPYSAGLDYFLKRHQWLDASSPDLQTHIKKLADIIPTLLAEDINPANRELRSDPAFIEPPADGECPYKGLNYFEETDADIFFGREMLIAKLVGYLRENHFLAVVVGASGSGKSSIVRAGMVPALRSGTLLADKTKTPVGSNKWPIYIVTPGAHPLDSLAIALTNKYESNAATQTLINDFFETPRALHLFIKRVNNNSNNESLLIVDQFEELFTLCQNANERKAFIDNIISASSRESGGLLRVVITLRADFYSHCADFANLREAVSQHQEYIGPMSQAELRRAIEEPALKGKWKLEAGLVNLLLKEVGEEPGALPLLSHALLETWQRREGRWLTVRGYMDSGGVKGAIARTAESVFNDLTEPEQKLARRLFLSMTELGEGTQDTRRRLVLNEILITRENKDLFQRLINKLSDSRLITSNETTVEVAHEALINEWPRLQEWLNEDRAGLRIMRRLSMAAQEWQQNNHDEGLLYRGARLGEAIEFNHHNNYEFNEVENSFLSASLLLSQREAGEREEQQRKELAAAHLLAETEIKSAARLKTRNRVISIIGAVALIAAIAASIFGVYAIMQKKEAVKQTGLAQQQSKNSLSQLLAIEAGSTPSQDLATLLSIESVNTDINATTLGKLQMMVNQSPRIIKFLRGMGIPTASSFVDVLFSPDQKTIFCLTDYGKLFMWDIATGQIIHSYDLGVSVHSMAVSADGSTLALGREDGFITILDIMTFKKLDSYLMDPNQWIVYLVFTDHGNKLISANMGGKINIWDLASRKRINEFSFGTGDAQLLDPMPIKISPDGTKVVMKSNDHFLGLWDINSETLIGETSLDDWNGSNLAFSPDSKFIVGEENNKFSIWDANTFEKTNITPGGIEGEIETMAFSTDGKIISLGMKNGEIHFLKFPSLQLIGNSISSDNHLIYSLEFSPDDKSLLAGTYEGVAVLWNIEEYHESANLSDDVNQSITSINYFPNGQSILVGTSSNQLTFLNNDLQIIGNPLIDSENEFGPDQVIISADGKFIAALYDKQIIIWDAQTHQKIGKPLSAGESHIYSIAFSPNNKLLAAGTIDGTIVLWDRETFQKLGEPISVHESDINSISFSPDSKTIASGGVADQKIYFTDVASRNQVGKPMDLESHSIILMYSPDGKTLASSSSDQTIRIWDVESHRLLGKMHDETRISLGKFAYSPDGKMLASIIDNSIVFWDTSTYQMINDSFDVNNYSFSFSPDGNTLISATKSNSIKKWNVGIASMIDSGCIFASRNLSYYEWQKYIPDVPYRLTCPDLPLDLNIVDDYLKLAQDAKNAEDQKTAENIYSHLMEKNSTSSDGEISNNICWFGSLDGFAEKVKTACDQAISLATAKNNKDLLASSYDSRGLARALSGDYSGAIKDFQFFVDYSKEAGFYDSLGQQREIWLKNLQAGKNPFTPEVLSALRN
jgi:WD40 repeat protein